MSDDTLLVYRALGLGDLLTAVPALKALARAYPHHRRVLAAPAWLRDLALHTGAIHEFVPAQPLAPLDRVVEAADVAINLHGRGPESHRVVLATRPRRLIAWAHPSIERSRGCPRWRPNEHEVERWCRLLSEVGIPADPRDLCLRRPDVPVPEAAVGATVVHPGASAAARRWPVERWAEVAASERARGRRVVVTGGLGDGALGAAVAQKAGFDDDAVLAGRTGLIDLAAVVGVAGRVVCGDTGIAHLATALGTPSVVLFGPTPPDEWGPYVDDDLHRVLWTGARGDPHATRPDPALMALRPPDVIRALDELDHALAGDRIEAGGAR